MTFAIYRAGSTMRELLQGTNPADLLLKRIRVANTLRLAFTPAQRILKTLNIEYPPGALDKLDATLPPTKLCHWLRNNEFVLVAGPPHPMTLSGMYSRWKCGFGWFPQGFEDMDFFQTSIGSCATSDTVRPGWLAMRRDLLPASRGKKWSEQIACVPDGERVPNAAEVAWVQLVGLLVHGYLSLRVGRSYGTHGRTSSTCQNGARVTSDYVSHPGYESGVGLGTIRWDDIGVDRCGVFSMLRVREWHRE